MEGRQVQTFYLGVFEVEDDMTNTIVESILTLLKKWNLDVGKNDGFRSDIAFVMVGIFTRVAEIM